MTFCLSLSIGGHVGARAAAIPSRGDSALHGLFVWATAVAMLQMAAPPGGTVFAPVDSDPQSSLWLFLTLLSGAATAGLVGWSAASKDIGNFPRKSTTGH